MNSIHCLAVSASLLVFTAPCSRAAKEFPFEQAKLIQEKKLDNKRGFCWALSLTWLDFALAGEPFTENEYKELPVHNILRLLANEVDSKQTDYSKKKALIEGLETPATPDMRSIQRMELIRQSRPWVGTKDRFMDNSLNGEVADVAAATTALTAAIGSQQNPRGYLVNVKGSSGGHTVAIFASVPGPAQTIALFDSNQGTYVITAKELALYTIAFLDGAAKTVGGATRISWVGIERQPAPATAAAAAAPVDKQQWLSAAPSVLGSLTDQELKELSEKIEAAKVALGKSAPGSGKPPTPAPSKK